MGGFRMAFMTYLLRRGATWHFRFRLPDDLRGREAPKHLPNRLTRLVNPKTGRIKHELTESLRTTENSAARARAGVLIADSELLITEARRFFQEGPPRTLPDDVIAFLAEKRARDILTHDDAIRAEGLGLDLGPIRRASIGKLLIGGEAALSPPEPAPRHGMSMDDLDLLTFAVDEQAQQLRLGIALHRTPEWIKAEVDRALAERGVELDPVSAERRTVDMKFMADTQQALGAIQKRNSGTHVPTPPEPRDPATRLGPHLSEALDAWKTGTLLPGMKLPSERTALEADFTIRRFIELHGDLRIGAITREQARGFVDAMWRLPTRLPADIERLKLPAILKRDDLGKLPRRSVATLTKHITLISAIVSKAGDANDLAFRGAGWTNPFDGLKPEAQGERERESFTATELAVIFGSPIYTAMLRPVGGGAEAAFWLPILGLLTGARLGELAQLRLRDVRQDGKDEPLYLDINEEGEGRRLKTRSSRRKVPVHPALIAAGFAHYLESRRKQAGLAEALLFPALAVRGSRAPGAAWSKWFGRWRRGELELSGDGVRKDFHSFRHTFKDLCRTAEIPEEVHDALTGHVGGGVGRTYGTGVPLKVLAEAVAKIEAPKVAQELRWRPATPIR